MNTSMSRRSMIAGAAALPAAAVLPFVPKAAAAAAAENPDAEIIASWYRVLDLERQYQRAKELSEPYWAAFDREINRAKRAKGGSLTSEEYNAAFDVAELQSPLPKPSCDDLSNEMDAPMRRVMDLPAHTPDGLVCKAQLVRMSSKLWDVPAEDLDWDDMKIRALVDGVLDYAARVA